MHLDAIKHRLQLQWRPDSYPASYQADQRPLRDVEHAFMHLTKAVGKIAAVIDDAHHERKSADVDQDLRKLLADLVLCTVQMAAKWGFNLSACVADRLDALDERWLNKKPPINGWDVITDRKRSLAPLNVCACHACCVKEMGGKPGNGRYCWKEEHDVSSPSP